jgi:hypothetical protein
MRRYIVLLLITGILWAQTDFDTLILKNGTTYLGEYSKIEGKIVYFKPQDVFALHGFSVNLIQTLKLKDGHFIIEDGVFNSTYTIGQVLLGCVIITIVTGVIVAVVVGRSVVGGIKSADFGGGDGVPF